MRMGGDQGEDALITVMTVPIMKNPKIPPMTIAMTIFLLISLCSTPDAYISSMLKRTTLNIVVRF